MMSKKIFAVLSAALFTIALLAIGTAATAADPEWITPTIQGFGKMVPAPEAGMQPSKDVEYKVVFSVTIGGDADKVNGSLDRVARAVNLFTSAGVPLSHLQFVAVVHGPATPSVVDNAHYRQKFSVDNPNLKLISELEKVGVKVVVCAQALAYNGLPRDWVDPHVEVTLSAITDIIMLEQQGFAIYPL
jgi:intracellular sulfur oxidation DsrE/DsrF family protein